MWSKRRSGSYSVYKTTKRMDKVNQNWETVFLFIVIYNYNRLNRIHSYKPKRYKPEEYWSLRECSISKSVHQIEIEILWTESSFSVVYSSSILFCWCHLHGTLERYQRYSHELLSDGARTSLYCTRRRLCDSDASSGLNNINLSGNFIQLVRAFRRILRSRSE